MNRTPARLTTVMGVLSVVLHSFGFAVLLLGLSGEINKWIAAGSLAMATAYGLLVGVFLKERRRIKGAKK